MLRRGRELLEMATITTTRQGRARLELKISTELERVWVRNNSEVIRQLLVRNRWETVDTYPLDSTQVPNLFAPRSPGCQSCPESAREVPPEWKFCPRCGAPIRRRARGRRTPRKN